MSRSIDHGSLKSRTKVSGPLVSSEQLENFREDAEKLAARVAKGHKSTTAHLHGPVRVFTDEEKAAWAAARGYGVR